MRGTNRTPSHSRKKRLQYLPSLIIPGQLKSPSPVDHMLFEENLYVEEALRQELSSIGLVCFRDFTKYSSGAIVSRPSKRNVRTLCLEIEGKKKKYFLKQTGIQHLQIAIKSLSQVHVPSSATAREISILGLFRDHDIPVMRPVAWGERRLFGWSMGGFILVEEVVGKEFVDVYRSASLRQRRRLMCIYGELMGTLHHKGIQSKVRPQDLICVSEDYENFRKCFVVIDRERGQTYPVSLSVKDRGKSLADIWIKSAFTIGTSTFSELLSFLSGYFEVLGIRRLNQAMCRDLVNEVMARAENILSSDKRFSDRQQDFQQRFGIPRKKR